MTRSRLVAWVEFFASDIFFSLSVFTVLLGRRSGIRNYCGNRIICFEQPDSAIFEVVHQFSVTRRIQFPRPHVFRVVNVSIVVHPFSEGIVLRSVAHNYQVTSWHLLQLAHDRRSSECFDSLLIPRGQIKFAHRNMQRCAKNAQYEHEDTDYWHGTCQKDATWLLAFAGTPWRYSSDGTNNKRQE